MKPYHLLVSHCTTALCAPVYFVAQMNDCLLKVWRAVQAIAQWHLQGIRWAASSHKALSKRVSVHANETSLQEDHFYFCTQSVKKQTQNYTIWCLITSFLCVANRNSGSYEEGSSYTKAVLNEGCVIKQQGLRILRCGVYCLRKKTNKKKH